MEYLDELADIDDGADFWRWKAIVVKDIHMRCELLARKLCQRLW